MVTQQPAANTSDLEQALHQKMGEMQQQPSSAPAVTATPTPETGQPAPAVTPPPAQPAPEDNMAGQPPVSSNPEAIEKAQRALEEKMNEMQTTGSQTPATAQAPMETARPKNNFQPVNPSTVRTPSQPPVALPEPNPYMVQTPPGFTPLPPPPPAVSASKEQKLDKLLQLYMADKISPEEYHDQRAKILAGQ